MRNINRIMVIMALSAIVPSAYSGSVNDTIATGDTLTAELLNNVKTAINDNDGRVTALETEEGVINAKVTALETEDGVINGKVTALDAADDDMNVRVSILEGQPKAKVGFGDPASSTDAFITGSEIGTVYIDIVPGDAYMAVAVVSDTAIWKRLTPKKYAIGDVGPAGGWVFYVTGDGLHGLEAAPVNQATAVPWGCSGSDLSGAQSTAIGSGARNTDDIIRGCTEAGIAAAVADDYISPSGYSDWYLPSIDELSEMIDMIGDVASLIGFSYWSSSEIDGTDALVKDTFSIILTLPAAKNNPIRVRAVRAF